MMNYIELINHFWQEVEMKDFLPSDVCVYFRLLYICNKLGWQNPFSLSNSRAVVLMAMNEKTFRAARDRLAGYGVIQFKKGKRRENVPMYCFPEKIGDEWIFDWGESLEVKITANTTANTTAYNKTKTKTIISPSGDKHGNSPPSLFAKEEAEEKKKGRRKAKQSKDALSPPTLDEVLAYFRSHEEADKLDNWEESARRFFDNFNAVDWYDKFKRKINRWDSRANFWISNEVKHQEVKNKNEPNSIHRRSTTEDALRDEQNRLAERIMSRRNRPIDPGGNEGCGEIP